jgi:hypothetical protein
MARLCAEILATGSQCTQFACKRQPCLHGSFGSGKSHFMAVLYLLLQRSLAARSIPELGSVVAKHDGWMQGKKFLLLTYYMLSAKDMEWQTIVPDGYQPVALYRPQWWQAEVPSEPVAPMQPVPPLPSALEPRYSLRDQAELPFVPPKARGTWVDRLLQSPVLQQQLEQAGRAAPTQEKLRSFLQALDERGGTMLRGALAQKLGEPELRIPGIVAAFEGF